jgi:hypothetical protein
VPEHFDAVPQRIGDAERDRAAEYLREHLAAGRLELEEFDDRLSSALTATHHRRSRPALHRPSESETGSSN